MTEYFNRYFESIMENHTTKQPLSRCMSQGGYRAVLDEFEQWLGRNKVLNVERIEKIKSGKTNIVY